MGSLYPWGTLYFRTARVPSGSGIVERLNGCRIFTMHLWALRIFLGLGGMSCFLTAGAQAPAEGATRVSHEDIWLMRRIGTPVLSPDGTLAVVSVAEPSYDPKEQASDLWLLHPGTELPARRLTFTKGPESGVTFSEDGTRIAFSARRDGDSEDQIYLLDLVKGGEAQRITDVPMGARSAKFSPDGATIAFVTDVWPGAQTDADNRRLAKERSERKANVRAYDSFPVRLWDHWLDERQPHLYVQELKAGATPRDLLAGSSLVKASGYTGRAEDDGTTLEPTWTPDGKGLVFTAGTDRDQAVRAFTHLGLWYVSLSGGEPQALTTGPDSFLAPRFGGPDGALYAEHVQASGHVYDLTHLVEMPFKEGSIGTPVSLTAGLDRSVSSWGVAANGTVYFLAEAAGHENLYRVRRGSPAKVELEMSYGVFTGLAVASRGKEPMLVARFDAADYPPELARLQPTLGYDLLTSFNARRGPPFLNPLESFTFKARNGRSIQSFLLRPPGFDPSRKYPLLVLLHGGPHSAWRDSFGLRWNYHLLAASGYVLLLTNYSGSTGFGEAFAQAIERDPLAGPAAEINEAADEAIRRYPFIDASRQCAGGASYGGHLANWLEASTTRYRCLVSHAGLADLEVQWSTSDSAYHREVMVGSPPWAKDPLWRDQSPIAFADQFKTPILLSVGEKDYRVPLNNTLAMWTALQRQQVPSRLLVFPDANHWITKGEDSRLWYTEVTSWLAKFLEPDTGVH
jgi:dipeptidyl aminopeptidase/acylaminoacyl peptidase